MTGFFDKSVNIFYDVGTFQQSLERKKRSVCKLKTYESNTDYRTWSSYLDQRRCNILERHDTFKFFCSKLFPWDSILSSLCTTTDPEKNHLEDRLSDYRRVLDKIRNNKCAECRRIMREIECCRNGCTDCHQLKYNLDKCALWNEIYKIIFECDEFKDCFPDCCLNYGQWSGDGAKDYPYYSTSQPNIRSRPNSSNNADYHMNGKHLQPCTSRSCQSIRSKNVDVLNTLTKKSIDFNDPSSIDYMSDEDAVPPLSRTSSPKDTTLQGMPAHSTPFSRMKHSFARFFKEDSCRNDDHDELLSNVSSSSSDKKYEDTFREGNEIEVVPFPPLVETRSNDLSCYLNCEDKKIMKRVKNKLYCLIDSLKDSKDKEKTSECIISELKSNIECLQQRATKQRQELCHIVKLSEQQQKQITCMERLERKLQEICQERNKLRYHLENYSNVKTDEIGQLKKRQTCLVLEVKKLQLMECQLNDVAAERDELCCKIKELEMEAKERNNKLSLLTNNLKLKEDRICRLQEMLNNVNDSSLHISGDNGMNVNIPTMRERMSTLKDKFLQLENVILTQDKCLHEQHSYILEQEELRVRLQKKIKELTLQHIQFLKDGKSSLNCTPAPNIKEESKRRVCFDI